MQLKSDLPWMHTAALGFFQYTWNTMTLHFLLYLWINQIVIQKYVEPNTNWVTVIKI